MAAERESDFHADTLDMYRKAAEVAAGKYDLSQSPSAIFVYWVKDLDVYRSTILAEAHMAFLWASLFFLLFLVPTYGFMTLSKRAKRN